MKTALIFLSLISAILAVDCNPGFAEIEDAKLAAGFGAYNWACGLDHPRSILSVSTGEVLVLESGRISCLYDDNKNGYSEPTERTVIVTQAGLNHGLAINGQYLYASSSTTVWRWAIPAAGIRTPLTNPEVVISGIPSGGHSTRTLAFKANILYVSCGSAGNVDNDASRSLIRSFDATQIPTGGYTWGTGTIFVIGLRNEVGLRFDSKGGLWGVENGVDNLQRNGVDIHIDNPGEEVNYFGNPDSVADGLFYGYPYCYSTFNLAGYTPGSQLVHPQFAATYNDSWCQNEKNVVRPKHVLPAHVAPLDLIFYPDDATEFTGVNGGDMFVSTHGSWNRVPAQGYNLYRVSFSNGNPTEHSEFFAFDSESATSASEWPYRPVGLTWSSCGPHSRCLLLSSDATGQIFAIYSSAASISASISLIFVLCMALLMAL